MLFSKTLNQAVGEAFEKAGYDASYGKVTVSNRPDLCEYQCNGALAAAKAYHCAPIMIANKVLPFVQENPIFSGAEVVNPGFLNLNLSSDFLVDFASGMKAEEGYGIEKKAPKTVIVDYGGPNVAKPLHIGHLRSAIIGESIKRIQKYMGNRVIGDTHLGDWGLQFGLIIAELEARRPELCYFDPNFKGEYPEEAPCSIGELEEIYPAASAKSKEDEAFAARAHEMTARLQAGDPACRALWKGILKISVEDLKKNYENLNVHFELWKGESDAHPYIPAMLEDIKAQGIAYVSEGALVVDVAEESDKREVPPCLVVKSDGAYLYATTDLATIVMRVEDYDPDQIIYLADKRQEMHYTQFFRVARKAQMIKPEAELNYIGFGTMNGKDGKPFKTRAGGVMRLESLISEINEAVYDKMRERYEESELSMDTVRKVALSAIKYGDLSNQATKDYIFDIDKFASFEGNTGPYILYTIVRIKSIFRKAEADLQREFSMDGVRDAEGSLKSLLMTVAGFGDLMESVSQELAPHKLCSYIYKLSDDFNSFYHETQILKEEDQKKKEAYFGVLKLVLGLLSVCIDLLGFEAPEYM